MNAPVKLPKVVYLSPAALKKSLHNARTHSPRQIAQIAASIGRLGFNNPILIDSENRIIAGHGRLAAAQHLGMEEVPTLRLDHMTAAEKRAYALADNRLAEIAGWDQELLSIELSYLTRPDIDFDVEITGFETADIDRYLEGQEPGNRTPEDPVPSPVENKPPVTRLADVWLLGDHRLICGDARTADTYRVLMRDERAALAITDPPYNVAIRGHVVTRGGVPHREFNMASGEMSDSQFRGFLSDSITNLVAFTSNGSIHYLFSDWRMLSCLLQVGAAHYTGLRNLCVWTKSNAGMGTFYRSAHELIAVFKSGTEAHINNFRLGETGRYRSNVWTYPGANIPGSSANKMHRYHPTPKPVSLIADALRDCSRRGDLVLDVFVGSGTIFVAAERTGRIARGIELDPIYVDVAVRRWQNLTGKKATLLETGETFAKVAKQRRGDASNKTRVRARQRRRKARHAD
jgi:DNA modification methylase